MNPRSHLNVHVGNAAQLVGAGLTCYGIDRVAGVGISLIVAGVVLAVLANFEWDATVLRLPLPARRPKWQKGDLRSRLANRLRWRRTAPA